MTQHNFKDQRILITGIEGFVGQALKERLELLGAKVFGISRSDRKNRQILKANILDYEAIDKFVKESHIQVCCHLASDALVEHGRLYPYQTFKVNVDGTLNILEIARKNSLKKIIIASTSHVYGKNKVPYIESYMAKPTRPYETSKTCADLIAQSYAIHFGLPILIPRFVNIYGPGDLNFERIIPKTIKSIIGGTNPKMWGGKAIRDYLYIDDAIEAYCLLISVDINSTGDNMIFNFGSPNTIEVEKLMQLIIKNSGKDLRIERSCEEEREDEISIQYLSSLRAKKILGWSACTSLNDGIYKAYKWYKNYFEKLNK